MNDTNNKLEKPPPEFYEFLELLGDKIKIKGWKGYKADLDVKCMNNIQTLPFLIHSKVLFFLSLRSNLTHTSIPLISYFLFHLY
jgi:hypothetical protein